jgi:hypothetical protein
LGVAFGRSPSAPFEREAKVQCHNRYIDSITTALLIDIANCGTKL